MTPQTFRTDTHNNPTAFTTDIAKEAGLKLGTEYTQGDPFGGHGEPVYYTARLIGDPIALTIRVIDAIGFITSKGFQRWMYICFPHFVWMEISQLDKLDVIGWMYQREGGVTMRSLFPNYGKL